MVGEQFPQAIPDESVRVHDGQPDRHRVRLLSVSALTARTVVIALHFVLRSSHQADRSAGQSTTAPGIRDLRPGPKVPSAVSAARAGRTGTARGADGRLHTRGAPCAGPADR